MLFYNDHIPTTVLSNGNKIAAGCSFILWTDMRLVLIFSFNFQQENAYVYFSKCQSIPLILALQ